MTDRLLFKGKIIAALLILMGLFYAGLIGEAVAQDKQYYREDCLVMIKYEIPENTESYPHPIVEFNNYLMRYNEIHQYAVGGGAQPRAERNTYYIQFFKQCEKRFKFTQVIIDDLMKNSPGYFAELKVIPKKIKPGATTSDICASVFLDCKNRSNQTTTLVPAGGMTINTQNPSIAKKYYRADCLVKLSFHAKGEQEEQKILLSVLYKFIGDYGAKNNLDISYGRYSHSRSNDFFVQFSQKCENRLEMANIIFKEFMKEMPGQIESYKVHQEKVSPGRETLGACSSIFLDCD